MLSNQPKFMRIAVGRVILRTNIINLQLSNGINDEQSCDGIDDARTSIRELGSTYVTQTRGTLLHRVVEYIG